MQQDGWMTGTLDTPHRSVDSHSGLGALADEVEAAVVRNAPSFHQASMGCLLDLINLSFGQSLPDIDSDQGHNAMARSAESCAGSLTR